MKLIRDSALADQYSLRQKDGVDVLSPPKVLLIGLRVSGR
jgi:hypothetical protein